MERSSKPLTAAARMSELFVAGVHASFAAGGALGFWWAQGGRATLLPWLHATFGLSVALGVGALAIAAPWWRTWAWIATRTLGAWLERQLGQSYFG